MTSKGTGPTVGMVAVGRPTFELGSAAAVVARAAADLRSVLPAVAGDTTIHTTASAVGAAVATWPASVRTLVILGATFTDSTLPAAAAERLGRRHPIRVVLWSFPERRLGGRLEWNSLCGAVLAAFRFRLESTEVTTVHGSPGEPATIDRLLAALGTSTAGPAPGHEGHEGHEGDEGHEGNDRSGHRRPEVDRIVAAIAGTRIGIVGAPPDGFEPCQILVDPIPTGASFDHVELEALFATAEESGGGSGTEVAVRRRVAELVDLEDREPVAVERAMRLNDGLGRLVRDHRWDAVAVRCWPECFTDWGSAACAPLSFLGDAGTPSACEADGYGALTCLLLQAAAGRPAFLADLVHLDPGQQTVAFWHCGVAPCSLADPNRPIAAIDHPNRGIPLALHFGLAPGPVTVARISQSGRRLRLFVGFGHVVDGPPPFLGTSGTVRFTLPVEEVIERITSEGLEHHVALVPGDHRDVLAGVAERWRLPLVTLTD